MLVTQQGDADFHPPASNQQQQESTKLWRRRTNVLSRVVRPSTYIRIHTYSIDILFPLPFLVTTSWGERECIRPRLGYELRTVVPFYFFTIRSLIRDRETREIERSRRIRVSGRKSDLGTETNRTVGVPWQGNNVWGELWLVSENLDDDVSAIVFYAAKNFQFFFPSIIRYIKSKERKFNLTKEKSYPCMEMSLL